MPSGRKVCKKGRLKLKRLKQQRGEVQGKPLETPDRRSQSPKGAVLRTCSSVRGNEWRRCGEEKSGGQEHVGRQMPFVGAGKLDPQAVARKPDEKDDTNELIAKWKEGMRECW